MKSEEKIRWYLLLGKIIKAISNKTNLENFLIRQCEEK